MAMAHSAPCVKAMLMHDAFLSFWRDTNFEHASGEISSSVSTKMPLNFIMNLSSVVSSFGRLACRKVPGTSNVIASLSSFTSIAAVNDSDSVAAVGLLASSLDTHERCVLPFAQVLPFAVPFLFSVRNTRLSMAFFRSSGVKLLTSVGLSTMRLCI